jgi:hypothetical protein
MLPRDPNHWVHDLVAAAATAAVAALVFWLVPVSVPDTAAACLEGNIKCNDASS